jgi:hypothetical protein
MKLGITEDDVFKHLARCPFVEIQARIWDHFSSLECNRFKYTMPFYEYMHPAQTTPSDVVKERDALLAAYNWDVESFIKANHDSIRQQYSD